ncbi:hypothetical protein ABK040_006861 [Willaertia magna]
MAIYRTLQLLFENILQFISLKDQIHVIGGLNKEIREKLLNSYFLWNLQFDIYFTPLIEIKNLFLLNNFKINNRDHVLQTFLEEFPDHKNKIKLQSETSFLSFYGTIFTYCLVDSYNYCKTTITTTPIFQLFKFFYSIFMDKKYTRRYSIFKENYNLNILQFLMTILKYTNFPLEYLYSLHDSEGYQIKSNSDSFIMYIWPLSAEQMKIEFDSSNKEQQVTIQYIKELRMDEFDIYTYKYNYPNDIIEMVKQIDMILVILFNMKTYYYKFHLKFFELTCDYNSDYLFDYSSFYNRKLLYFTNSFSANYVLRKYFNNLVKEKVNYLIDKIKYFSIENNQKDNFINYLNKYPTENEVQSMLKENLESKDIFVDNGFEEFKLFKLQLLQNFKEDSKKLGNNKYRNRIDIYLHKMIRKYLNLFIFTQPQYTVLMLQWKNKPKIHKVNYKQLFNFHYILNIFLLNTVTSLVEYRINKYFLKEPEEKWLTQLTKINYEKISKEIEDTFCSLCFHSVPTIEK